MRGTDLVEKSVFKLYYVALNMHNSYMVEGDAQCENTLLLYIFFHGATTPHVRPGPPRYRGFAITLIRTTLGKTPLEE